MVTQTECSCVDLKMIYNRTRYHLLQNCAVLCVLLSYFFVPTTVAAERFYKNTVSFPSSDNRGSFYGRSDDHVMYDTKRPTSQTLIFAHDPENEAVFNNTLLISKTKFAKPKEQSRSGGVTYYQDKSPSIPGLYVSNHQPLTAEIPKRAASQEGAQKMPSLSWTIGDILHGGSMTKKTQPSKSPIRDWLTDPYSSSTYSKKTTPVPSSSSSDNSKHGYSQYFELAAASPQTSINNHRQFENKGTKRKPSPHTPSPAITWHISGAANPSMAVKVKDQSLERPKTDVLDVHGERIRHPEKVTSIPLTVLDAPDSVKTKVYKNLIVARKRMLSVSSSNKPEPDNAVAASNPQHITVAETTKGTSSSSSSSGHQQGNFPSSPVMDPWSNIPIPSMPSWASSSKPQKGTTTSLSSPSRPSMFPGVFSIMPFLNNLVAPFLKKPLSPEALNTGMQGIKAMQRFLRNSLIGAIVCFLPSALIAISLSATQRAEFRKMPEVQDRIFGFCEKCLENFGTDYASASQKMIGSN